MCCAYKTAPFSVNSSRCNIVLLEKQKCSPQECSFLCRQDSTIVTPYESWQYYDPSVVSKPQNVNYAGNKTKKVAWFVSNCGARNGRLQYAQELSKYIRHPQL